MELRELEAYLAVAADLHFGAAARRLHLSQPTVTEAVRRLERELGGQLFERTTRRVSLTPLGAAFLVEAETAVAAMSAAYTRGRNLAQAHEELVVAYSGIDEGALHRAILRNRHRSSPGTHTVVLVDTGPDEALAGLANRAYELAVGLLPVQADDELTSQDLHASPLGAIISVDDDLAAHGSVTLAQLAERPLITWPRSRQPSIYDQISDALEEASKSWSLVATSTRVDGLIARVISGQGCALVPACAVPDREILGAVFVPVIDTITFTESAVWRKDSSTPALTAFVATLQLETSR